MEWAARQRRPTIFSLLGQSGGVAQIKAFQSVMSAVVALSHHLNDTVRAVPIVTGIRSPMNRIPHVFLAIVSIFSFASQIHAADVVSIWGGARGTIVLKSDGTVWTWGANFGGKLGIGDATTNRSLVPVEVHGAGSSNF